MLNLWWTMSMVIDRQRKNTSPHIFPGWMFPGQRIDFGGWQTKRKTETKPVVSDRPKKSFCLQIVQLSSVSPVSSAAESKQSFAISSCWAFSCASSFQPNFPVSQPGISAFPSWILVSKRTGMAAHWHTATPVPGWAHSFDQWLPWGRDCFYIFLSQLPVYRQWL